MAGRALGLRVGGEGKATPDSDVDLLFVLAPDARLGFALFDLEEELAEIGARATPPMLFDGPHREDEAAIAHVGFWY